MFRSPRAWKYALCCLALCSACTGDARSDAAQKQACEPGTVYSCVNGPCTGSRVCLSDGSGFTLCACNGPAAKGGSPALAGRAGAGSGGARPPAANGGSGGAAGARAQAMPQAKDAGLPHADKDPDDLDAGAPAKTEPERCDNGQDDDGDGKIDCADEDCSALQCVTAAPSGWQGPVAFRTGSDPLECLGAFEQRAFAGGDEPDAPGAQCTSCTCEGGCSPVLDFGTSTGAQCDGASCTTSVNASCAEISPQCLQSATTASLKTALPATPACKPSEQRATLPEANWKTHVAACQPPAARSGGCADHQQCLPRSPGPGYEAAYCIWSEGEQTCPMPFSHRRVYYRELADTRACSACSCASPTCAYTWRVFNVTDTSCASPLLELTSAGACVQVNPVMGRLRVGASLPSAAACAPAGGESTGKVTGAKPVTVCCGT